MARQRVVVIEGLAEIRDVLEAVLAPRGMQVDWIRTHADSIDGVDGKQPDLLVIEGAAVELARQRWNSIPKVVIRDDTGDDAPGGERGARTEDRVLRIPFQFPELIDAVESLLPPAA